MMKKRAHLFLSLVLLVSSSALAGGEEWVMGTKYPNSPEEGSIPVQDQAQVLSAHRGTTGFEELLPYVLRSPNQEDAGSCLYMSLTGAAEFWLAKLNPSLSRAPDGPVDLSERYFMNVAGVEEAQNGAANWKTDTVFILNKKHQALRNKDYRFTKGWYQVDSSGSYVAAQANQAGASYDTSYNWINQLSQVQATPATLPTFSRKVIFADPASNQWNVGVAPKDIVSQIKVALTKNKAPVQVIYNHMGYWHSVLIVGFDDDLDNGNCPFVERFLAHMTDQVAELSKEESAETNLKAKAALHARVVKTQDALDKASLSYKSAGGCNPKGAFYVRDSIYEDPNGPVYDYDPSQSGDESPYGKTVVLHEYDWVTHLANHVVQIFAQ